LALGLAVLLHPALLRRLSHLLQRLAGRPREEVVAWRLRQLAPAAALAAAGWALHGVAGYFLVRSLAPVPPGALPAVALAFVAAWGAGFLAFVTPAGLGVREAALTVLLAPFLPRPLDALAAVLGRLSWVALELLGLAASALVATRSAPPAAAADGPAPEEIA
ncbi:MAG TPA: lysylphosphatidylglycerol synthase domain-containing protein, partial [Thermoanaerobaculia bacterium]|nr:lysylphosphatidylglycerol synthase domain-containing protein [Thermoanaerobaculia bacterium]